MLNTQFSLAEQPDIHGIRAVSFVRHATQEGIDRQIALTQAYAERAGANLIELYAQLGGPSQIEESTLRQIIDRKERLDDFDILLMFDCSRLTRGGVFHLAHIMSQLRAVGITTATCASYCV